jgi:hypothetical protein
MNLINQPSLRPTRKVAAVGWTSLLGPIVAAIIAPWLPGLSEACGGRWGLPSSPGASRWRRVEPTLWPDISSKKEKQDRLKTRKPSSFQRNPIQEELVLAIVIPEVKNL